MSIKPNKTIFALLVGIAGAAWALSNTAPLEEFFSRNNPDSMSIDSRQSTTGPAKPSDSSKTSYFKNSAFYNLRFKRYPSQYPDDKEEGSGIALIGEKILVSKRDGTLYLADIPPGQEGIKLEKLPHRIPLNRKAFLDFWPNEAGFRRFRVADIMAEEAGDSVSIYATHHWWKNSDSCYVVRLSKLQVSSAELLSGAATENWQTLYESSPCLSIQENGIDLFKGHEAGGRIVRLDQNKLLVTLGHHGFDGVHREAAYPQDRESSYGKTWIIDELTKESRLFTLGHRNPQGLHIDQTGNVWSTEHGPQGGDELNLLWAEKNYGWPTVTYGTDYFRYRWPLNKTQAKHPGFTQPTYAWVPSIGVSNLIRLRSKKFGIWKDNLIIGSLKEESIFRVTLNGTQVASIETISVGERIRDLAELPDGRIVLQTQDQLITVEPGERNSNSLVLFEKKCGNCHARKDKRASVGPSLEGIAGRKIASTDYNYSTALTEKGGTWTRENLDAFLADPQKFAPGTTMQIPPITAEKNRKRIVDLLFRKK